MLTKAGTSATQEAEAGELQLQGQPGQFRKTLPQNKSVGEMALWYDAPGFNLSYSQTKT